MIAILVSSGKNGAPSLNALAAVRDEVTIAPIQCQEDSKGDKDFYQISSEGPEGRPERKTKRDQ